MVTPLGVSFWRAHGIYTDLQSDNFRKYPRLLLGWTPFIGFVFALWSLVLGILGIRELEEISTIKAILAMVIAFLIPLIFIILLAAYLIPSNMVVMPDPVHGGTWGYT